MRIGEVAQRVGISTDSVRFYERSGWLPRASRRDNTYREYGESDVEHLRLLIELRRLDLPLADASRIAGWCHSGHCADTTAELPGLIDERRREIASRIDGLRALDARLAELEHHMATRRRPLAVLGSTEPCCDAAGAIAETAAGTCALLQPGGSRPGLSQHRVGRRLSRSAECPSRLTAVAHCPWRASSLVSRCGRTRH